MMSPIDEKRRRRIMLRGRRKKAVYPLIQTILLSIGQSVGRTVQNTPRLKGKTPE